MENNIYHKLTKKQKIEYALDQHERRKDNRVYFSSLYKNTHKKTVECPYCLVLNHIDNETYKCEHCNSTIN